MGKAQRRFKNRKHGEPSAAQDAERLLKSRRRMKILPAVGLGVVLCIGTAGALYKREQGAHDFSRPGLTETIRQKKTITFQFMEHRGTKQPYCGFRDALKQSRPDLVFLESPNLTPQDARLAEIDFNSQDLSKALSYIPPLFKQPLLDVRRQNMEEGRKTRILIAEAYSQNEIWDTVEVADNEAQLGLEIIRRFMVEADVDGAIELAIERGRIQGGNSLMRNDRMLSTITDAVGDENLSVLLLVGEGHLNLVRLFSAAGYDTASSNCVMGRRLSIYFESLERGWEKAEPGLRDLAAREIAVLLMYGAYGNGSFGYAEEWSAVAETALPEFPERDLWKMAGTVKRIVEVPEAINGLGYHVPVSDEEFKAISKRLGYDRCGSR